MPPVTPETLLCFDFGERRIGVALGNSLTQSASALTTVESSTVEGRFEGIARLITQWAPARLVVGRSVHADGTPQEFTRRCERFARQLHGRFNLPVEMVDEQFSSIEARATMRAGAQEDAEAAAILLRQYFHEHSHA